MKLVIEKYNANTTITTLKYDNATGARILEYCLSYNQNPTICETKSYTHSKWKLLQIRNEQAVFQQLNNIRTSNISYHIYDENPVTIVFEIQVSVLMHYVY